VVKQRTFIQSQRPDVDWPCLRAKAKASTTSEVEEAHLINQGIE